MQEALHTLQDQLTELREKQRTEACLEQDRLQNMARLIKDFKSQSTEVVQMLTDKNFGVEQESGHFSFALRVWDREYSTKDFEISIAKEGGFVILLKVDGRETARSSNITIEQIFNYIILGLKQI